MELSRACCASESRVMFICRILGLLWVSLTPHIETAKRGCPKSADAVYVFVGGDRSFESFSVSQAHQIEFVSNALLIRKALAVAKGYGT